MTASIVLAYSGGLDTSVIIPWLKETKSYEVHCLAGDVGQGDGELDGLEAKALATGAASCRVVDLRDRFLTDAVWPCLRSLAVYEGRYLLGTSMARPVLAQAQVEYAREVGATAVGHGCTGKGNDQVRFELAYQALAPDLKIEAPWRDPLWTMQSREDAIDYAQARNIPVAASRTKIYSRDRNLWHLSHEGGSIEDPAMPPPDDAWQWTADPDTVNLAADEVTVDFVSGIPVGLNGQCVTPVALLEELNQRAAIHGIGRVDIVENRLVGMKSRGLYETPGGTVLFEALRTLRALTVERDTMRVADRLAVDWAQMVYTGRWFHPLRTSLDAFFTDVMASATGSVRVRLHRGRAVALSSESPNSLYAEELATFGAGEGYAQADATGFVKLYGLPGRVAAATMQKTSTQQGTHAEAGTS